MEWKTIATLGLALVAGVTGALLPDAQVIAAGVAGACLGAVVKQPKHWGKKDEPK